MNHLDVYMGNDLVGALRDESGELKFNYTHSWLVSPVAIALTPSLVLDDRVFSGQVVNSFFENLLPEGTVRAFIARSLQLSPENVFGLLERLGGDTAGAFSILPAGKRPASEASYTEVSREVIKGWLAEAKEVPLTLHSKEASMSLSGAQDKLTVFIDSKGGIFLPKDAAPSSHIIKPAISYRHDVPHSAINESFVMILANRAGLNVPSVKFDDYLNSAIIARYDRVRLPSGGVRRLHQGDFCQLLDMPSSKKYESEGGPSFKQCIDVIHAHSSQPAVDIKRAIEWVAFNLVVGNMDSHAKNLSMLFEPGKASLSPFYDLVSTSVYPVLSRKFAFKIGGENRPEWIQGRHWDRMAEEIHVRPQFVKKIVGDIREEVSQKMPEVLEEFKQGSAGVDAITFLGKISSSISKTINRMRLAHEAESKQAKTKSAGEAGTEDSESPTSAELWVSTNKLNQDIWRNDKEYVGAVLFVADNGEWVQDLGRSVAVVHPPTSMSLSINQVVRVDRNGAVSLIEGQTR